MGRAEGRPGGPTAQAALGGPSGSPVGLPGNTVWVESLGSCLVESAKPACVAVECRWLDFMLPNGCRVQVGKAMIGLSRKLYSMSTSHVTS